jgi:hypothetical protein
MTFSFDDYAELRKSRKQAVDALRKDEAFNYGTKTYVVSLRAAVGDKALMQTSHDYLPYAQSQADTWKQLYPTSVVTIDVVT